MATQLTQGCGGKGGPSAAARGNANPLQCSGIRRPGRLSGVFRHDRSRDPRVPRNQERGRNACRPGGAGIVMSRPLGFSNTYAIGMRESGGGSARHPDDLRPSRSSRAGDRIQQRVHGPRGWLAQLARHVPPSPARRAGSRPRPGLSRARARRDPGYRSLFDRCRDWGLQLRVLRDDLGCFPAYDAVWLYRADLRTRRPRWSMRWRDWKGRSRWTR